MKNILIILTTLAYSFLLYAQDDQDFNTQLFNQIQIDFLIDNGLQLEKAIKIDRNKPIPKELFVSLLDETLLGNSNIDSLNNLKEEMKGEFYYNKVYYNYTMPVKNNIIKYESLDGTISGKVDIPANKWVWIPIACFRAVMTCKAVCIASCSLQGGVKENSCGICGIGAQCVCFPKESGEI